MCTTKPVKKSLSGTNHTGRVRILSVFSMHTNGSQFLSGKLLSFTYTTHLEYNGKLVLQIHEEKPKKNKEFQVVKLCQVFFFWK